MSRYSHLSDEDLYARIHELEAQGHTAGTSEELYALDCEQTDRLSDGDLVALIRSRAAQGKRIGKLAAAARARGIAH